MSNDKFLSLLEIAVRKILRHWIPRLTMKGYSSREDEEITWCSQEKEPFDDALCRKTHCVSIGDTFFVFEAADWDFSAIERALIDWTVSKVFAYANSRLSTREIERIIQVILPDELVAACLFFAGSAECGNWNVFTEELRYFGPTAEHLPLQRHDVFDEKDQAGLGAICSLLTYLEEFSLATNEGSRFNCTVAVLEHEENAAGKPWDELSKKQFIKCLSSESTVFFLDKNNRFIRYSDMSAGKINSQLQGKNGYDTESDNSPKEHKPLWERILEFEYSFPEQDAFIIRTTAGGDVFIYKNRRLLFQRRDRNWLFLNARITAERLHGFVSHEVSNKIRVTMRDKMLEKSGCCLGLFPEEIWDEWQLGKHIVPGEIEKLLFDSGSISPFFWENSGEIRKRLLGIDGAVLIESETGKIYAVGAIIKNAGASGQGARTTAAKTIASLGGLALKVSDDGYLEMYEPHPGINIEHISPSFSLGK